MTPDRKLPCHSVTNAVSHAASHTYPDPTRPDPTRVRRLGTRFARSRRTGEGGHFAYALTKQLNPVGDQQTACAEIGTASSPTASASTRTGVDLIDASGVDRLRNGGLEQRAGQGCERISRRERLATTSRVTPTDSEFPKMSGRSESDRDASALSPHREGGSDRSAERSATKAGHL